MNKREFKAELLPVGALSPMDALCANCGRTRGNHRNSDKACPVGQRTRIGYIHFSEDMSWLAKPVK